MRPRKQFFVHIMSNGPRSASLYTGITGNLTRLVYYEAFAYPDAAIACEKEIKGWRREKKLKLIQSMNPRWNDLAKNWQNLYRPEAGREIPRPAGESAGLRDDASSTR